MTKVAIVYHSGYGHTEVQANHVQKGADSVDGVSADLIKADDAAGDIDSLKAYDAIIFGAPTYMGSASAGFKAFMDASSKAWMAGDWKDKIAAGFTNSGSLSGDKFNTLVQFVTLAAQHGMIWVSLGAENETAGNDVEPGDPTKMNRVGAYLGAMAQSDNKPPSETPESGDLKTAEHLGKRVSEAAKRWAS